ncbi:hypothetical protein HELRODRAFT_161778 [Helobdella robusta]|uniref:WSC domain-containing protein n=1 Tax=Helobdella robusta TaxID=6412 RepID=T1ERW7_HELRO|nr:hypothetical protein HELRODRAFT_161778 [Helobdella robusta]ESO02501.1 hypothetical protein HELRODRAFT_161778 [Helobdella robusta]
MIFLFIFDANIGWLFRSVAQMVRVPHHDNRSSVAHAAIDLKESYIGCYRNISSTKTVASVGSVDECSLKCTDESNNMIALKSGEECNCIGRLDSAVASSQCDVPCTNGDACGGSDSYSVYKSKPRVMHDSHASMDNRHNRSIEMTLPADYTLETCAHFCLETNHTFFQKIADGKCECFQELAVKVGNMAVFICDQSCLYDPAEICDCHHIGYESDETVIFATRFQYDFQRGASTYSHCNNRGSERFQVTKCSDGCEGGWRGDWCRERDCRVWNGDCGSELNCVQLTVNGNEYVECVCPRDTVRNKWNKCEVMRKNLALNKPSYCSTQFFSGVDFKYDPLYLTDGMYDGFHLSHIGDNNPAWLAVDLLNSYHVGFVRAYNRWTDNADHLERMSKFVVRLNETFNVSSRCDIRNKTNLCGYGPENALQSGNPMIVFCENFALLSQFVIIQQSDDKFHNGNTALAELEVFEAGCDLFNGRCEDETCVEVNKETRTTICCGCLVTTLVTIIKSLNKIFNENTKYFNEYANAANKSKMSKLSLGNFWYVLAAIVAALFLFAVMVGFIMKKKLKDPEENEQKEKEEENENKEENEEETQLEADTED